MDYPFREGRGLTGFEAKRGTQYRRPGKEEPLADNPRAAPRINAACCKGCERCIAACPQEALVLSEGLNSKGFHYVQYSGDGCTGCGACFYNCPEPEAIQIFVGASAQPKEPAQ